ncbi:M28 family metallopeptidase [Fibrella aquatilis]|nr:M20/M25/M40 family metallo-hydrolase [Fibrella aquatilis]
MITTHSLLQLLTRLPHRGAATPHEREAAQLLVDTLAEAGAATRLMPFQTPKTYATVVYWIIGGLLSSIVLVISNGFLLQQVGLVICGIALTQAWLYFNWRHASVVTWPVQHTALNVLGQWPVADRTPPTRRVVLLAHYDTAPVSALYNPKQQRDFQKSLQLSLGVMTLTAILLLVHTAVGLPAWGFWLLGLVALYLVAQAILGTVGFWNQGYTNGASDNATGVVAAIETAKRLRENAPPGLLVEVVLPSAEEVGMIGAHAYWQANKGRFAKEAATTAVINFDTLGAGKLTVIERTGTVEMIHYDSPLTQLARDLVSRPAFQNRAQVGRWHTADFDSVWFVRAGIPTLALCALAPDGTMPRIHRPDDILAAVDETPMHDAVDLAEAVVREWCATPL